MKEFGWTEKEKAPYRNKAREMLDAAALPAEIDHSAFGISKEGTIVYLKPIRRNKRNEKMWKTLKKMPGFEEKNSPGRTTKPMHLYGVFRIPWME